MLQCGAVCGQACGDKQRLTVCTVYAVDTILPKLSQECHVTAEVSADAQPAPEAATSDAAEPSSAGTDAQAGTDHATQSAKKREMKEDASAQSCTASCTLQAGLAWHLEPADSSVSTCVHCLSALLLLSTISLISAATCWTVINLNQIAVCSVMTLWQFDAE